LSLLAVIPSASVNSSTSTCRTVPIQVSTE
jgi:hypothetical protein